MGQLVHTAIQTALDGNGDPVPNAKMDIYHTQSEIRAQVFEDFHLTHMVPNPLHADGGGDFPVPYLTDGTYRVVIRSARGEVLTELDNVASSTTITEPGQSTEPAARVHFNTVAEMLADTTYVYTPGQGQEGVTPGDTITADAGYSYLVLDPAATELHLETAGGVRLKLSIGECDPVPAQAFGLVANDGTDQLAAAQMAVDFAAKNGSGVVMFPRGIIELDGTLRVGEADSGLSAVKLQGSVGSYLGSTRFVHGATQLLNPMLNIAGARMVEIADIELRGNNAAPGSQTGENQINATYGDWISAGCSDRQLAPYAGISLAGLNGTDPGVGLGYDFDSYGQDGLPSKIFLQRVRIQGFVAAVVLAPNAGTQGVEDILLRDCALIENTYGVCTTGSQQRNVVAENCNVYGHFCAFDNVTFGSQGGQPVKVQDCNLGKSVHVVQSSTDIGQMTVSGCYFENIRALGMIGQSSSGAFHSSLFHSCNVSLIGHDNDGTEENKDTVMHFATPTKIDSSAMVSQSLIVANITTALAVENTVFRSMAASSAGQEHFEIFTPFGQESKLMIRDCHIRAYSGSTPTFINDVQTVSSVPNRAKIARNTQEIVDRNARTRYKITPHPISYRGPSISAVSYDDADTVSFDITVAVDRPLMVDDLIYWRLLSPAKNDVSASTVMAPGLMVTDITGTRVTCAILAMVDTTYVPTNIDALVPLFINETEATGDTIVGSDAISNVSEPGNFRVGDWIVTDDPDLPQQIRITAISGSTLTCHRTMNRTLTGVTIFNSRLTAI